MIKAVVLYSDIDNLIVIYFVAGVGVFFLMRWFIDELKYNKNDSVLKPREFNHEVYLDNYTFNFNKEITLVKKTSLLSKIILFSLSMVIAVLPLYEFIETLRPVKYELLYWSCIVG
jgi:hypothetical protein